MRSLATAIRDGDVAAARLDAYYYEREYPYPYNLTAPHLSCIGPL